MRIHGGSIFVEFVETPHPRIYIINVIVSKTVIEHFDKKKRNDLQHSQTNKHICTELRVPI